MSREATLCLGVWLTLGFLVVSLCSCGYFEAQERKKQAQTRQQAIQKALESYPDAKEFPSSDFDQQFTIQVQDFFSGNSGPFYVVAWVGSWGDVDIERSDNGVFLSYWEKWMDDYRLRLRCSPEQISQVLTGAENEDEQIIVFTVDNVRRADTELSAYLDDPEYGSYTIELEKGTLLIVEGELVAVLPLDDEGPTP